MHARSCGETGGSLDIDTAYHRINAGNCCGAEAGNPNMPKEVLQGAPKAQVDTKLSPCVPPFQPHTLLHASAPPTPCCLNNCDQDTAGRKLGIYPKWVWFGKGPGPTGGKGKVQEEGAQVQKKGSHLQKNCSKVHEK